jgi:hypothetical protein
MSSQPTFTWSLQAGSPGSIDATSSLYTAPGSPGSATVLATAGAVQGNATVTVINTAPTVATSASASLFAGGFSAGLIALGADDGGEANLTYTWAVTAGPSGVTFTANGTNDSKNSTALFTQIGSYTFAVTIRDSGGLAVTSSASLTVGQSVSTINVSPSSIALPSGGSLTFSASALDQFGNAMASQPTFVWSLLPGSSGIINASSGLYLAPVSSSNATVVATAAFVSGVASVTVGNGAPAVVTPAGAAFPPGNANASDLTVLASDDGGEANLTYAWAVTSGPAGANFSDNGTNAAKDTTATFSQAGDYGLTVTVKDSGGLTTTSTVNVDVAQILASISVTPFSTIIPANSSLAFNASATDQFGNAFVTAPAFAWNLASGSAGSINPTTGIYKAAASGSATIIAASGAVQSHATLTITPNHAPTIASAAHAAPSPVTGTTTALTVLGADDGGAANLIYTWTSTGPAAVSFSANGTNSANNSVAAFIKAGAYRFTATITDSAGLKITSSVSVTVSQTLTAINVTPANVSLEVGKTQMFKAQGIDQFGNAMSRAPAFAWSLAAGSVGTIGAGGKYTTPHQSGSATATASAGSLHGSATITVTNVAPAITRAAASNPSTVKGKTAALSVVAADDGGAANLTYTWALTAGPASVTFNINGTPAAKNATATFSAAGAYQFTVTVQDAGGLASTSSVNVTVSQTYTSVAVSPTPMSISGGSTQQFLATALDQFSQPLLVQPAFKWTATNTTKAGTIDAITGLFSALNANVSSTITATSGAHHAMAILTITALP